MTYYSRKHTRLPNYDYNSPGYYFITICTKDKQKTLSSIVGTDVPGGPCSRIYEKYEQHVSSND